MLDNVLTDILENYANSYLEAPSHKGMTELSKRFPKFSREIAAFTLAWIQLDFAVDAIPSHNQVMKVGLAAADKAASEKRKVVKVSD
jgi:hypothetical protein